MRIVLRPKRGFVAKANTGTGRLMLNSSCKEMRKSTLGSFTHSERRERAVFLPYRADRQPTVDDMLRLALGDDSELLAQRDLGHSHAAFPRRLAVMVGGAGSSSPAIVASSWDSSAACRMPGISHR